MSYISSDIFPMRNHLKQIRFTLYLASDDHDYKSITHEITLSVNGNLSHLVSTTSHNNLYMEKVTEISNYEKTSMTGNGS